MHGLYQRGFSLIKMKNFLRVRRNISECTSCHPSLYKRYAEGEAGCFPFVLRLSFILPKDSKGKKDLLEVDITKMVYMNCDDV